MIIKKIYWIFRDFFLKGLKQLVFFECIILFFFKETKGDGLLLRIWLKAMGVEFGERIFLYYPFYLYGRGNLDIGDYCSFGEFTKIWNFDKVVIGNDFMAAEGLTILTGGHDVDTLEPLMEPVRIGDRVWCGANVTILPGVTIGDDVVVGAGALVTKDVLAGSVVAGVPAKVIKMVDVEKRGKSFYSRRNMMRSIF